MTVKEKIKDLVIAPLNNDGFDLVEMKLAQYKNKSRVQLFVDSDNGVTIDDCVRISRMTEAIIDEADLFRHGYTVEVSSPGLDRPLKEYSDFRRRIGETVKIFFENDNPPPVEGKLTAVTEKNIAICINNTTEEYEIDNIRVGKIIL